MFSPKRRLACTGIFGVGLLLIGLGRGEASGIFAPSYSAGTTFKDGLGSTSMTLAFDGTSYWSSSGGSSSGNREARYDAAGNLVTTYAPGLDFRSIFTDASGNVFARQFANSTIYQQTSPGVFGPHLTLSGGSLDTQSSVVLDGANTEYDAVSGGVVRRWNTGGTFLGTTALSGYGSVGSEGSYPEERGLAAVGNYWLTYDGTGRLSAWDFGGNRVGETILVGAGTSFDSDFSLSYANNQVFVVDRADGTWRGYDVGLSSPTPTPEPTSLALLATGGLPLVGFLRRRRKA